MSMPAMTYARRAFAPNRMEHTVGQPHPPTPWSGRQTLQRARRDLRPAPFLRYLVDFYRDPVAWLGLLVSALVLAYGGGVVMFLLHAIYLGEGGPAISPVAHWALDSTAGFVGLTPAIALIVPLAVWASSDGHRIRPAVYALVGGAMFALATAPGPILHDLLVGRGTWVAAQVTSWVGNAGAPTTPPVNLPHTTSIVWQLVVGLPTYVLLTALALWLARGAAAAWARSRTP